VPRTTEALGVCDDAHQEVERRARRLEFSRARLEGLYRRH
jgi:hypothetical protein